ncbi:hypothetical protein GCM10007938_13180 [Vibrio zhanjiangensis]|uniref:Uncharacterized protein n=1 Tax=Vibrio zhanjiangensis TaxID=1046128 RepID=A0ABQ6EYD5_9VIBR|nr:hypothetical protein [Vibrio zhanjiangensis]GLT17540.1 hypothetical protein GCM10007938_13180 [Vibrio zhanjiangensis]
MHFFTSSYSLTNTHKDRVSASLPSESESVKLTSMNSLDVDGISQKYWLSRNGESVVTSACQDVFSSLGKKQQDEEVNKLKPKSSRNPFANYFHRNTQGDVKTLKNTGPETTRTAKAEESEAEIKVKGIKQHMVCYVALILDRYVQDNGITVKDKKQVLSDISEWLGVSPKDAGKSSLESGARVIVDKAQLDTTSSLSYPPELKRAVRDKIGEKIFQSLTIEMNKILDKYVKENGIVGSGKVLDKYNYNTSTDDNNVITSERIDEICRMAKQKVSDERTKGNITMLTSGRI